MLLLAWIAVAAFIAEGCGPNRDPVQYDVVVVGLDRSGSTEAMRSRQIDLAVYCASMAFHRNKEICFWLFDNEPYCFFGPSTASPSKVREHFEASRGEVLPPSHAQRRITRPALLLQRILEYSKLRDRKLAIVLLTDGGSELPEDDRLLYEAAARLAARGDTVLIAGIRMQERERWDRILGPTLGNAFSFSTETEAKEAIGEFLDQPVRGHDADRVYSNGH